MCLSIPFQHHVRVSEAGHELEGRSFAAWAKDLPRNPRKQGGWVSGQGEADLVRPMVGSRLWISTRISPAAPAARRPAHHSSSIKADSKSCLHMALHTMLQALPLPQCILPPQPWPASVKSRRRR